MQFSGRVALITGGTGALGRVAVQQFAGAGAKVVVPYRSADAFAALQGELGDRGDQVRGQQRDITDERQVAALVEETLAQHGAIHFLLNLAGGYGGGRFTETDLDQWEEMFQRNFRTALLCTHTVLPQMLERGHGRIVNVGSRPALEPAPRSSAYAAAKAAVISMTQSVAREIRTTGVTINCIVPSVIDTAANRAAMPKGDPAKWVRPEEVVALLTYLCSDAAAAINGAAIPIYGGV